jgi:hypothetical protein
VGSLIYGTAGIQIDFDDRLLAHLEAVFNAKLRRRESFLFSWRDDPSVGDGRGSIWIDAGIPIYFRFNGSRVPALDREWLEQLVLAASSTRGLALGDDPHVDPSVKAQDNSAKRKDHPAR